MNQPVKNTPASLEEIPGKSSKDQPELRVDPESKPDFPTNNSFNQQQNLKSVVKTPSTIQDPGRNNARKRVSFQEDIRVFNVKSFKNYNKAKEENSDKRCCGRRCLIF